MKHIFISYARYDVDFARELQKKLVEAELPIWMDRHIEPGDDWEEKIDQALRDAWVVLVIVSAKSSQSYYVTYEWSYALGLGVKVIPLIIEKTDARHPKIAKLQHLEFDRATARPWGVLISELKSLQKEITNSPSTHDALLTALVELRLAGVLQQKHLNVFLNYEVISADDFLTIQNQMNYPQE